MENFFSLCHLKTKFTFHISIYISIIIYPFFLFKLCRNLCKFSSNTGDAAHVESRQFKKQPNKTKEPNVTSIPIASQNQSLCPISQCPDVFTDETGGMFRKNGAQTPRSPILRYVVFLPRG